MRSSRPSFARPDARFFHGKPKNTPTPIGAALLFSDILKLLKKAIGRTRVLRAVSDTVMRIGPPGFS